MEKEATVCTSSKIITKERRKRKIENFQQMRKLKMEMNVREKETEHIWKRNHAASFNIGPSFVMLSSQITNAWTVQCVQCTLVIQRTYTQNGSMAFI